jgi:hypothetical protein
VEQLQQLRLQHFVIGYAGDVAGRVCNALHKSLADRIGNVIEHDRCGRCGLLGRDQTLLRRGDDQRDTAVGEIGGKARQLGWIAFTPPVVGRKAAAFDQTCIGHSLVPCVEPVESR